MGRQPCCDKLGVKKGPWTAEEDRKLVNFILTHGQCCWRAVPKLAGLHRCGKSCRLRWTNYLRPDLKRGLLNEDEEQLVIELHARLGNRWSKIAAKLPGRTDNEIKNHWNTHIKKKLIKMGIDPVTHEPLQTPSLVATTTQEATVSSSNNLEGNVSPCQQEPSSVKDYDVIDNSCDDLKPSSSLEIDTTNSSINFYWTEGNFLNDFPSPWNFLDPKDHCSELGLSSVSESSSCLLDFQANLGGDFSFSYGFPTEVDVNALGISGK